MRRPNMTPPGSKKVTRKLTIKPTRIRTTLAMRRPLTEFMLARARRKESSEVMVEIFDNLLKDLKAKTIATMNATKVIRLKIVEMEDIELNILYKKIKNSRFKIF